MDLKVHSFHRWRHLTARHKNHGIGSRVEIEAQITIDTERQSDTHIWCLAHEKRDMLKPVKPAHYAWWRRQMETFSALLAICEGNSPVDSPYKGQWRGVLMFSLICAWTNGWANNRNTEDLRIHCAHHDVIVMEYETTKFSSNYAAYKRPFISTIVGYCAVTPSIF